MCGYRIISSSFSAFQNFREHPIIEGTVEEACVTEVSCYNPSFPVNKLFASLKKLKSAAEQTQEAGTVHLWWGKNILPESKF